MKNNKRKETLHKRSLFESLRFQVEFGVKQRFPMLSDDDRMYINIEIEQIKALDLVDDILTLKGFIENLTQKTGITPISATKADTSTPPNTFTALGMDYLRKQNSKPIKFNALSESDIPIFLSIFFHIDERNKVVDFFKANRIDMSTYLGQPMIKLRNIRFVLMFWKK